MSFRKGQEDETLSRALGLHPVLVEKLNETFADRGTASMTLRDATLPPVKGKVHAVTGMRRAGKTTFLRQLLADRRKTAPAERSLYVSFDDDRLGGVDVKQLSLLLEEYFRRFPELRREETAYWFLDEIQLVPGWERFVRRVIDSEQVEIVVSGSSSRMLSREVHTSLRGRGMETVLRPFGFREFLRFRGEEPPSDPARFTSAVRSRVEKRFREYLREGGFPEAQGLPPAARVPLLQGYVDTVVFRDVVERWAVTQVAALRWLVRQCLRNPAGAFSVHRFHLDLKAQGHGVAKDQVHAMVGYLVDAFLLSTVPLSTESERRRNSNPRKVYPADPGLVEAFDASGRAQAGHALETAVFNELQRRDAEVGYVRTEGGLEVDFHTRSYGGREELIQVCADPSAESTCERETRALEAAAKEFPRARRRLLVMTTDHLFRVPGVEVEPAWKWMLSIPD